MRFPRLLLKPDKGRSTGKHLRFESNNAIGLIYLQNQTIRVKINNLIAKKFYIHIFLPRFPCSMM